MQDLLCIAATARRISQSLTNYTGNQDLSGPLDGHVGLSDDLWWLQQIGQQADRTCCLPNDVRSYATIILSSGNNPYFIWN
jgi:hypothetical protein